MGKRILTVEIEDPSHGKLSEHQQRHEVADILQRIAQAIGDGHTMSDPGLKDRAGRIVGSWEFDPS